MDIRVSAYERIILNWSDMWFRIVPSRVVEYMLFNLVLESVFATGLSVHVLGSGHMQTASLFFIQSTVEFDCCFSLSRRGYCIYARGIM